MPQVIASVDATVQPDDGQIFVIGDVPEVPCVDWADGRFAYFLPDLVLLGAEPDLHSASVCLEAWDGAPPPAEGAWEDHLDGRVWLGEESVAVSAFDEMDLSDRLMVGEPGWYGVRVYLARPNAVARSLSQSDTTAVLERFLVQFWPDQTARPRVLGEPRVGRVIRLTEDEQAMIAVVRDEWIAHGLAAAPADRDEAVRGVYTVYQAAGLPEPQIVWLDSPLAGSLAAHLLTSGRLVECVASAQVRQRLGELDPSAAGTPAWIHTAQRTALPFEHAIRDLASAEVQLEVQERLKVPVTKQVTVRVHEQIARQLGEQRLRPADGGFGDTLWPETPEGWDQFQRGPHTRHKWGGQYDAMNLAVYDFYHRVCGLSAPAGLDGLLRVAVSAGWWWPFTNAVIITERPTTLHVDPQGDLHRADGPALVYPDGWSLYAWHGTLVPSWVITGPTPELIAAEPFEMVRHCALEAIADRAGD